MPQSAKLVDARTCFFLPVIKKDTHTAVDHLRRQVLRREIAGWNCAKPTGARLHLSSLIYAVKTACRVVYAALEEIRAQSPVRWKRKSAPGCQSIQASSSLSP